MLSKDKLERLNVLAQKHKAGSLTTAETEEQKVLRLEYIKAFRGNFEGQLQSAGLEKKPKHVASRGCSCGCGHKH